MGEGSADPAEELRFCPEERGELFSSFKKCILRCSKRRGGCLDPPPPSPASAISSLPLLASSPLRHPGITAHPPETSWCASAPGRAKAATAPAADRANATASLRHPGPGCLPHCLQGDLRARGRRQLSGLLSPSSHRLTLFSDHRSKLCLLEKTKPCRCV